MKKPIMYHIPVCPFSQRIEILLERKGLRDAIEFYVVDITKPRPAWLLEKSRGTTALPILEVEPGKVLKESLVILQFIEQLYPEHPIAHSDPYQHAVENMLITLEGPFVASGYHMVMNKDPERTATYLEKHLTCYAMLNDFLEHHSPDSEFLFEDFGWAEVVFTPFFVRFAFLDYYEDFALPEDQQYDRVRKWREACLSHPAAQQVTSEEVIKVYYDYAKGAGNGALLEGRTRSSFVFEPHWKDRPWPPKDKYNHSATDQELGLL